jgi:hypothetical protein
MEQVLERINKLEDKILNQWLQWADRLNQTSIVEQDIQSTIFLF